ncbi:DUF4184 family protein [Kribbella pittospori]|uniref:DUF4184 family protein n=1 Tax=Kribbella pittospori TaxID=722689 RepID=UPI0013F43D8B|nr:DUF4184 family protein [Kribbella pittospori]
MPFTLAHPAAILPLVRRPLVASALVAGAVAPDLLYLDPIYRFATQGINGNFTLTLTHKLSSALWLDPLLALILLVAFTVVVQRPLLALAPAGLAARLPTPSLRVPSTAVVLWTVVSAMIGALTHVLWDSFTHYDGYFVLRYHSFFTAQVTGAWDVNRILQYVSTVGGCLVLAIWLYRWYRRVDPQSVAGEDHVPPWVRYVVLAAMVLIGLAGDVVQLSRTDLVGEAVARSVLTGVASGCLAALAWYVVLWHLFRLRRRVAAL